MNEYAHAMDVLFGIWLPQSDYECTGAPFELYTNPMGNITHPDEPWDVCFCLPVRTLGNISG